METKNYQLQICIPTYNRKEKVIGLVDFLIREFSGKSFCLTVRDNDSADGTFETLRNIYSTSNNVFIERNDENIGLAGNLYECYLQDKAEFLWVVGDDDWIGEGIAECIYSQLGSSTAGCLYINYQADFELGKVDFTEAFPKNISSDETLISLFSESGSRMMFISSMIFRVGSLKKTREAKAAFFYPRLTLPLYVALAVAEFDHCEYIRSNYYLKNIYGDISWRSEVWKVFLYKVPMELFRVYLLKKNLAALRGVINYFLRRLKLYVGILSLRK